MMDSVLEICKFYAKRVNSRSTGRKILYDLAERISRVLPNLTEREIKIALLRLNVFSAPVPRSIFAERLSGLSKDEMSDLWARSMDTPFNIEGVRFAKGFKNEIKNMNEHLLMTQIAPDGSMSRVRVTQIAT